MKTLTGFILLIGIAACSASAADTVPPRTLPSHPEPQSATSESAATSKEYGGAYAGYQRIVSNGQERYCRNDVATGSRTERKAVCLTAAQMRIEQLKAQQFVLDMQRRAGAERQLTYIYGNNAGMASNSR